MLGYIGFFQFYNSLVKRHCKEQSTKTKHERTGCLEIKPKKVEGALNTEAGESTEGCQKYCIIKM